MHQHEQEKRISYIKKLVSHSKAIISHQVGIPLGCQTMEKYVYWIDNIEPLSDIDLKVFSKYNSKVQQLPIGPERLSYNKDFLIAEDYKLDYITTNYKTEIIEKCFEIIQKFDVGEV